MYDNGGGMKHAFYIVYVTSAVLFISSIAMLNGIALMLSSIALLTSVVFLHSGQIVNNLLIKRSAIVEVSGNYRLSSNTYSISRDEGNGYKSISIATVKPVSPNLNRNALNDLINSLNEQFEFSIELMEVDKSKILENLRTRLRVKEIALSRINPESHAKVNSIRRQLEVINGDIESLASSGKSFQYEIKLKSIYFSMDRSEAELYSYKNIESLSSKFSAALGVDCEILSGERLLQMSGV